MKINLETEAEKQQLEFVSPNPIDVDIIPLDVSPKPIDVDPMSRVPLDFRIKLFEIRMCYDTPEARDCKAEIIEARGRYQGARMRYLTGMK